MRATTRTRISSARGSSISSSSIAKGLPSPKRQRREFAWLISFSSRFGIVDVTTVFQRM
jgi:hypothetical protein